MKNKHISDSLQSYHSVIDSSKLAKFLQLLTETKGSLAMRGVKEFALTLYDRNGVVIDQGSLSSKRDKELRLGKLR